MRATLLFCAVLGLTACAASAESPVAALSDTRVTFPPPDANGGPIIFEFYGDGTATLVFNETAERGQTEMTWRIDGTDLCMTPLDSTRDECTPFTLEGQTISMGLRGAMIGTIELL